MATLFAAGAIPALAEDQPADPITRLGERSAEDRWKEARKQWLPFNLRKARRQERQNAAAAAEAQMPVAQSEASPVIEAPAAAQAPAGSTFPQTRRAMRREAALRANEANSAEEMPPAQTPFKVAAESENDRRGILRPRLFAPLAETATTEPEPWEEPKPVIPERAAIEAPRALAHQAAVEGAARGMSRAGSFVQTEGEDLGALRPSLLLAQAPAPTPVPSVPEQPEVEVPPAPEAERSDRPLPAAEDLDLPREPLTNTPLQLRKITDIKPFRGYSPGGTPSPICPPDPNRGVDEARPRCPEEEELPVFGSVDRDFIGIQYCWEASNIYHNPLYFEDFTLERYGHTYPAPMQSATSVGKFGLQLVGLPYQLALDHFCNKEYPLGYYRPGECAPYRCYQIPLNAKAAAVAAGTYTGVAFLFP